MALVVLRVFITVLAVGVCVWFIGALTGRFSRASGVVAGIVLGLVALFPVGCVTRSDPTEQEVCHTFYGLPLPNEVVGIVSAICLAGILAMTAAYLCRRRPVS